jgi:hypothetical protein
LGEVEKMFFPYSEANASTTAKQGDTIISGLEIKILKDVDTRDNSEIYVVKVITKVDDFKSLRREIGSLGGYYSRFKRGFIFKENPTAMITGGLNDSAANAKVGECA